MRPVVAVWRRVARYISRFHVVIDFLDCHHGSITALATVVIAILTCFYVVYSKALWEISNKALDANERAWVLVQAQGFVMRPPRTPENPNGYPVLTGVIVNTGKSPAFKVVSVARVSFELMTPEMPSFDSSEWKEGSGLDLAPNGGTGSTSILNAGFGPKGFPPDKYAAVEKANVPMWIWVWVRYSDPFSEDRFTQKCVRYTPKMTGAPIQGVGGAAYSGLVLCPSRFQIHR